MYVRVDTYANQFEVDVGRITTDPNDERLAPYRGKSHDEAPTPQQDVYLALPPEAIARGFVVELRETYRHRGAPGPTFELVDLTDEDRERFSDEGYVKYEPYPEGSAALGRYWTQAQLDAVGKGCGVSTTMPLRTAETYARNPWFYGGTYCAHCCMHRPMNEFVWLDGTEVDPTRWPVEVRRRVQQSLRELDA